MIKKYLIEGLKLAVLVLIVTNVISYFRTKDIKTDGNLQLIEQATTIDGKSVKELIDSKKPLIINFWGTWCPVCNQEVSTLSKLATKDDINLITVAVNSGSNEEIKKYMQQKGIKFNVINDNKGLIATKFGINTYPTTLFISPNRENIIKDSGYTTYAGFLARVKMVK